MNSVGGQANSSLHKHTDKMKLNLITFSEANVSIFCVAPLDAKIKKVKRWRLEQSAAKYGNISQK
jgi:hypothetical protein